jgi:hypothetical protein
MPQASVHVIMPPAENPVEIRRDWSNAGRDVCDDGSNVVIPRLFWSGRPVREVPIIGVCVHGDERHAKSVRHVAQTSVVCAVGGPR